MFKPSVRVLPTTLILIAAWGMLSFAPKWVSAQSSDSVYKKNNSDGGSSTLRGKIISTSKDGVTVRTKSNPEEMVPAQDIRRIGVAGESSLINRARERMLSGRYDDCLSELAKITDTPDSELIQTEIAFMKSSCQANKSLRGENVTAQQAGSAIRNFVQTYPDSFHFYPATHLLGQLFVAIGKPELAEKEFAKLSQSQWPSMRIKGFFERGNALLLTGDLEGAKTCFSNIGKLDVNDDEAQQFKLVAQCQLAKIMALEGKSEAGQAIVEKIIKEENPDNGMLFAYAYNTLGTCHVQSQQPKPAAIAFLHTELLYGTESDPHAEALYNLAKLWPQLEETDRANRARQALKSRYRNTYWALQL